jgi:hypothetical protein
METSKILAEAVLNNYLVREEGQRASCRFCKVWLAWEDHDSECPVIVAEKAMKV